MALTVVEGFGSEYSELRSERFPTVPIVEKRPDICKELIPVQPIPLAFLNTIAQHRGERNGQQAALTGSILAEGMLNPIDATILCKDDLASYIDFTNRLWGEEKQLDECVPYAPDHFIVVVAGHSRLLSHQTIANDNDIDPHNYPVDTQLRPVNSIEDFLGLQISENIHSQPPVERSARGYAEAYRWHTENTNQPLSKAEFARKHGITADYLTSALYYADLPCEVRLATDAGLLPYSIAVELGRALPVLYEDIVQQLSKDEKAMDGTAIREGVLLELEHLIAVFNGRLKRHITNGKAYIRNHVDGVKQRLQPRETEALQLTLIDARGDPIELLRGKVGLALGDLVSERAMQRAQLHNTVVALARVATPISTSDETALIAEAQALLDI